MSEPLVAEVHGLRRAFAGPSGSLDILKGIDLELHEGEIVAVQGRSGVGKSTLLHILGLLDQPTSGTLRFHMPDGQVLDPLRLPAPQRAVLRNRFVAFVFQFFHLLPDANVLENVLLPSMIQLSGWRFGAARKRLTERARELLAQVGVQDRELHRPNTLSGGERQRVSIARALMNEPRLLLCDEPTGNLDTETSERIHDLFVDLNRNLGTTILIVTHDPLLAGRAHRRLFMEDGLFRTTPVASVLEE